MYNKYLLILSLFLSVPIFSQSQQKLIKESEQYQTKLNKEFAERQKSPLAPEDFEKFVALDFFKVNLKYRVKADFKLNQFPVPFEMQTTTDRKPIYQKYGTLSFTIDGVKCQLTVYQNLDLMKNPEYHDYLFIPFTDMTNGKETYGGGRYLDLKSPLAGKVDLDFNKAYNPYCAYNGKYSCPIPPKENDLKVSIKAGVKKFH